MTGWLKLKLMGLITFINAAIGVTLGGLLYTIWPDHYFKWYPSIPIFYWVMAIVMTYILDRKKRKNGKGELAETDYHESGNRHIAVFSFLPVRENLRMFGFTLMLFYFIYLGLETYTVYLFEKKRMKREKKENDEQYQK